MSFISDLITNVSAFRITIGNKINALKTLIDGRAKIDGSNIPYITQWPNLHAGGLDDYVFHGSNVGSTFDNVFVETNGGIFQTNVGGFRTWVGIGTMSNLTTTHKTTIVGAINEVNSISNNKKEDAYVHSQRDFPNGTLIETDIDYSQIDGDEFLLEIKANTYNSDIPLLTFVQGYIYDNTLINYCGFSTASSFNQIIALNLSGKLHFWFPRIQYWQGFSVKVNSGNWSGGLNRSKQRIVGVYNNVDPGGTKRVAIGIKILATRDYADSLFVKKDGSSTMDSYLKFNNGWSSGGDAYQTGAYAFNYNGSMVAYMWQDGNIVTVSHGHAGMWLQGYNERVTQFNITSTTNVYTLSILLANGVQKQVTMQTSASHFTINSSGVLQLNAAIAQKVNDAATVTYVDAKVAAINIPNGQLTFNVTSDFVGGFTYLPNGNLTTTLGLATHILNAIADGQAAYNFGDHATQGYLKITDLAPYETTVSVNNKLTAKQDKLIAGANVSIVGNTISATDTVTRIGVWGGNYTSGDINFTATGAATIVKNGNNINIDVTNSGGIPNSGVEVLNFSPGSHVVNNQLAMTIVRCTSSGTYTFDLKPGKYDGDEICITTCGYEYSIGGKLLSMCGTSSFGSSKASRWIWAKPLGKWVQVG